MKGFNLQVEIDAAGCYVEACHPVTGDCCGTLIFTMLVSQTCALFIAYRTFTSDRGERNKELLLQKTTALNVEPTINRQYCGHLADAL